MPGKRIALHLRSALALAALGVTLACGYAGDGKKPALDADGAALPDGALKRLGSLHWRHGEPITFLAMPADGKTLITATHDSVLRLWDRETGKEIRRFVPDANAKKPAPAVSPYLQGLTRAAMSKDGKVLAVALPNNIVQLWDVETGKALRQITSTNNGVGAMAFSPDGNTLAVRGVNDRVCFLHETDTGKEIRKLKPVPPGGMGGNIFGGAGDGTGLAFSPDGKIIALPELEFNNQRVSGSVTLFELATGKEVRRIEAQANGIAGIAFSPDGKTLVFNTHSAIYFHEADTGRQIRQVQAVGGANLIIFAPDGQTLAVKGRDQLVRILDAKTGNPVRTLGELPGQKGGNVFSNPYGVITTDVVFSADSKTLVIGGQQVPRFFDLAKGAEQPLALGGHLGDVSALMISADGKTIASRGAEGVLRVWNADSAAEVRQIVEPRGTSAVLFSPDGKLVAFANNDGVVRLIDVADGKEKRQFKAHQGTIATLAFSPDGQKLATRGAYDGLIRIFDVAKGAELKKITYQTIEAGNGGAVVRTVNGQASGGQPLVFSPDAKTLATFVAPYPVYVQGRQQMLPDSNCLRLFDVGTGKEVRQIPMPAGPNAWTLGRGIKHLVYSVDGRLLLSENTDKTISLWEIASGQERSKLGEPIAPSAQAFTTSFVVVNGVARSGPLTPPVGVTIAASRDGSLIAAPGPKNTIKILDLALGKEIGSLPGHDGPIASLVFAADGKTLVSGGHDTTILVWDLTRLKREPRPQLADLQQKDFDPLWADLFGNDAGKAGKAVHTLIAASDASVALLKDRIQPTPPLDAKAVEQWLRDLDSSNFTKRAIAIKQLQTVGELALPALQKRLAGQPSLETRRRLEPLLEELTGRNFTPEQVRVIRAIEVLDRVGTPEARKVLERLANGTPGSLTTQHAQMSLDRLIGKKN
jgi:WD40 repeat protein